MAAENSFDVLIIGSGAAGLSLALRLPGHVQVAVLAKSTLDEGCTLYAQGGISAVAAEDDTGSLESIWDAECEREIIRQAVQKFFAGHVNLVSPQRHRDVIPARIESIQNPGDGTVTEERGPEARTLPAS